ncbi:BMA-SMC-5, isoform c [Dirofilaria immitis]|nr:BMA-SMC-5, isoform c [Dirofilaria immitis]
MGVILRNRKGSITFASKTKWSKNENSAVKNEYLEWNMKEEELDRQKSVLNDRIARIDSDKRAVMEAIDVDRQSFQKKFVILQGEGREMKCDEAWHWYESQRENFGIKKYIVDGAILWSVEFLIFVSLLETMSLVSDDAAIYLENIIARRDLLMFIFRCKEDELLLTDKRHPWKINSCVISDDEIAHFQRKESMPTHLCSLGFTSMASNLYIAPDAVKAYLNSVASLHKIPIGNQTTEKHLDEVCEALKNSHRFFLTNSLRVRISVSRYNGNLSVRTEALRTSLRFLIVHTALPKSDERNLIELERQLTKLKELENEIRLAYDRIGQTEKNIAQGRERCRRKMNLHPANYAFEGCIYQKKDARNIISSQLRSKAARLQAIENNKPDLNVADQKFRKTKSEIITKSFERVEKIAGLMEKRKLLIQNALFATLNVKKTSSELDTLLKQLKCFEEEYESKLDAVKNAEINIKMATQKLRENKQRLYEAINVEDCASEAVEALEILKRAFVSHAIPNTKEEVELETEREQGKLDALHNEERKSWF